MLINTRYYTFIKDSDEVQEAFDAFNEDYQQYITDELITQTDYEPGKAALPERPAVDISPKQKIQLLHRSSEYSCHKMT